MLFIIRKSYLLKVKNISALTLSIPIPNTSPVLSYLCVNKFLFLCTILPSYLYPKLVSLFLHIPGILLYGKSFSVIPIDIWPGLKLGDIATSKYYIQLGYTANGILV